jgi:hypothetical protein
MPAAITAASRASWLNSIGALLGVGLLVRRTARVALAASIAWALGVWWLGEGLTGLASGQASLINGAPGSAFFYAVLAAAAWPRGDSGAPAWLASLDNGAASWAAQHGLLAVALLAGSPELARGAERS